MFLVLVLTTIFFLSFCLYLRRRVKGHTDTLTTFMVHDDDEEYLELIGSVSCEERVKRDFEAAYKAGKVIDVFIEDGMGSANTTVIRERFIKSERFASSPV